MELTIILVVLGLIFIVACVVGFIRWNARRITFWFSVKKLEINKSIKEYTELLLEENELFDVKVKKCGFFSSLFVGNTYSLRKKTIRLSWFVARRSSPTTLATACQLVGLAKLHAEGVKGLRSIELFRWLSWLPVLLVPLAVIGLVVDFIAFEKVGMYTLIFSAVGLVLTLFTFILACVASRKTIKSYNEGEKIILGLGILNQEEENKIKKLYSAWKKLVIINVIYNSFATIFFILRVLFSSLKLFGRK